MSLRPPRMDEAAAVAELVNAAWPEPITPELVEREWTSPRFDLEQDARLAPGACAAVWDEGDGKAWIEAHGEPTPELLAWAEGRARERGARRALGGSWSTNEPVKRAFEERGFAFVRHSYRMAIDLAGEPATPAWPEGVELRTFRPGDEQVFYEVHQETFEDSWEHSRTPEDEWRHFFLEPPTFEPDLWFLASEEGEPAGIAICHRHWSRDDTGWVGILGVRRPWRRRGLARALLLHSFAAFRGRGLARAGLGVDADSLTGAHRLYESAGMAVEHRFDMYEKSLA